MLMALTRSYYVSMKFAFLNMSSGYVLSLIHIFLYLLYLVGWGYVLSLYIHHQNMPYY